MNVIKNRFIYFIVSGILVLSSLGFGLFSQLNLGIDMTGGVQMEYSHNGSLSSEEIISSIKEISEGILHEGVGAMNGVSVYAIVGEDRLVVVGGFYENIPALQLEELKNSFRSQVTQKLQEYDSTTIESKYVNIGKSFGDYIRNTAFLTLGIALVAITFYIVWAFSGVVSGISILSFGAITLLTLFHDIIISTGLYIFAGSIFSEFQIDTFFVTALLTILGYSINDTIVVFDRVRSNLREFAGKKGKKGKNLEEIINMSIGETVTRSIYTSATLLFVLIAIFFFGPESMSGFILVMIFGTIIGTYSSLFIASPLLYEVNKNKILSEYVKKEENPDDKLVV
ncbi:protein translocase subunit SecF [Candidatus Gracilibacteria bacterium]|nr:protein translocase subunit SecF [Candidatus Gracilibacteria bacterium]